MQIFPQSSQSAKMFGNSNNAYSNNQAESAKGIQQAIEAGQAIITAIMSML